MKILLENVDTTVDLKKEYPRIFEFEFIKEIDGKYYFVSDKISDLLKIVDYLEPISYNGIIINKNYSKDAEHYICIYDYYIE